jgi:hypothetical protein
VSVDGSTNLSGITDWKVGDWAIYVVAGAGTDGWQKVDNSSVLDGSGTGGTMTAWAGSGTSNTLTDSPVTFTSAKVEIPRNIEVITSGYPYIDLGVSSSNYFRIIHDNPNDILKIGKNGAATASSVIINPSGNVGIGAVPVGNPGTKFLAVGTAGSVAGGIQLWASSSQTHYLQFGDANSGGEVYRGGIGYNHASETLLFLQASSTALSFTGSQAATFAGDVNITNSKLQITAAAPEILFSVPSGGLDSRIYNDGSGNFIIGNGTNSSTPTERMRISSAGNVGIGTTVTTAALNVLNSTSTAVKATRIGNDTTSIYSYATQADAVLAWTCGSYHNAEVVITASQTNGGDYNNLYIRGIWSNNHTSHHWDELEHVGGLTGSTITMSVGQNGSTTNSGRLELDFNYTSGSFATLNIRVTDFYGSHSYTIT